MARLGRAIADALQAYLIVEVEAVTPKVVKKASRALHPVDNDQRIDIRNGVNTSDTNVATTTRLTGVDEDRKSVV